MQPPWQSFATFAATREACLLSVLYKRSYGWDARGRVFSLDEQPPLAFDVTHAKRQDRNGELPVQGRDTWPLKQATDVVVTGHARTPRGVSASSMPVAVCIGDVRRELVALGPRYVERAGPGQLAFSPPALFTEVDVSFWNAYGGIDPFVVPRGLEDTPCLALPLLEQPEHRLTPESLLVREPEAWGRQPRPAAFGWCHSLWFPRLVQAGGKPYHLPRVTEAGRRLRELELGALEEAQLQQRQARFLRERWVQEAAPELTLPFLRGDEGLRLEGFDILGAQQLSLPGERPMVHARVDGRELAPLADVLHTLAIDADRKQLYLLRSQRYRLPGDFADDLCAEEPLDDLLGRCEVSVGGRLLERERWPAAPAAKDEKERT
jgi:hypothetical protein